MAVRSNATAAVDHPAHDHRFPIFGFEPLKRLRSSVVRNDRFCPEAEPV